jgi:hypothetical protein
MVGLPRFCGCAPFKAWNWNRVMFTEKSRLTFRKNLPSVAANPAWLPR